MNESQKKGKIFEAILKFFLKKHGYQIVPESIRNYYGIKRLHNGLNLKGRGAYHQIDALGQFSFQIPFIYPIRLLSEAKCKSSKIRINTIRDFVGVVKDISENYFIENYAELNYNDKFRFTDCGAIFSTSAFTKNAQTYAYAQGVYLVPSSNLLPLVKKLYSKIHGNDQNFDFENILKQIDEGSYDESMLRNITGEDYNLYCYFGIVAGFHPIIITSDKPLPMSTFRDKDDVNVRFYYRYYEPLENQRTLDYFEVAFDDWKGRFELPRYTFIKYFNLPNFKEAMLDMKKQVLNHIDIPLINGQVRRIIRLKLDKEWIEAIQKKRKQITSSSVIKSS